MREVTGEKEEDILTTAGELRLTVREEEEDDTEEEEGRWSASQ